MGAITHVGPRAGGSGNVKMPLANNKVVSRWQNDSGNNVSVNKAHFYWGSVLSHAGIHARAVVYSDNAGSPDTLLGTSDEITAPATTEWVEFTFPSPFTVNAGDYCWIGIIADGEMTCTAGPVGSSVYNADTYSDGASATFGATSSNAVALLGFISGDDGQLRFGRSAVDPMVGNYQPSREHGDRFTFTVPAAASVSSISTYVGTTDAGVKSKAAIFEDNSGVPGAKIAQTDETTGATANSWLTCTFATPVVIAPGTYWLCFICDTNLQTPVAPSGGELWVDGSDSYAGAFSSPSTLLTPAPPNGIDIYATYTEVAEPTTAAQLSQLPVEVARSNNAVKAQLSQLALAVLSVNPGVVCRFDQCAVEVLRPNVDEAGEGGDSVQRYVVCT